MTYTCTSAGTFAAGKRVEASCLLRSDGPVSRKTREMASDLSYDPLQSGWVSATCHDDISFHTRLLVPDVTYAFRSWRSGDAPVLAEFLSDRGLWQYLPDRYPGLLDVNGATDLIHLSNISNHHYVQAIEWEGRVIGQARIAFGDNRDAELSYWLGRPVWGQGHGGKVIPKFVEHCFTTYSALTSLFAVVHMDNPASRKVLSSAGFAERKGQTDRPWLYMRRRR